MPAPTPPPAGGAQTPPPAAPNPAPSQNNPPSEPSFFDKLSTPGKFLVCAGLAVVGSGILAAGSTSATGRRHLARPTEYHSVDENGTHKYTFPTCLDTLEYRAGPAAHAELNRVIGRVESEYNTTLEPSELQRIITELDQDHDGEINLGEARNHAQDITYRVIRRR